MKTMITHFAPAERATEHAIRQDAELYASANLINSVLDAVPDIVLVLNEHRQAVYANEAGVNLLRLTNSDQALGQRPGELLSCAHATETEGGCGTTQSCRNCGIVTSFLASQASGRSNTQECRVTLRNGNVLDLRATAKPLQMRDRQFTAFTLADISHEKRRRALERIFFHDVLNTASVVYMTAEVMKEEPKEIPFILDGLFSTAHRLLEEIRSQQDLVIAENGELTPVPTTFNAARFLDALVRQFTYNQLAAERQIQLVDCDESLTITSDRVLLGRIVGNMLKNALEATPAGGTVSATCFADHGSVTFAVHNPSSMPHNVQLQVFNRSFSTKGQGRGLGTYSMKLLSERYLGGNVRFESTPEHGTTFFATFPIA